MKILALAILALSLSISSFAQSQKLTIYGWIDKEGRSDYGDLEKWLPGSLQKEVLVHMKESVYYPSGVAVMYMTTHGWKLVGADPDVHGSFASASTDPTYMFTREIEVDDKTMSVFKQRMDALTYVESPSKKQKK